MKDEIIIEDFIDNSVIELEERMHMPVLENLTIIPSENEQIFKSKKDGFNEVRIKKVEGEELNIIPSAEEQVKEGLYEKVTVSGDNNLVPENIKGGVEIFKVKGTAEMADEELVASFISLLDDSLGANIIKLPNNLTSIGNYAFYYRNNLISLELPEKITKIGSNAFSQCSNLKTIKIPNGITRLESYTFYYCENLQTVELPDSLTYIGTNQFASCSNLEHITIPDKVTAIGDYSFQRCTKLKTIQLPVNLKSIYGSLFRYCENLTELIYPGDIGMISNNVMEYCSNLTKVVFPNNTKVPTLSNKNSFQSTPIASGTGYIYVPDNLVNSFKTATNWSIYANQIKGISEMEG